MPYGGKYFVAKVIISSPPYFLVLNNRRPFISSSFFGYLLISCIPLPLLAKNLPLYLHCSVLIPGDASQLDIFYTVKSDGWDIHVREQRPPMFDPEKKYPVIFSVYGGPKYYQITDKYRKCWPNFFTKLSLTVMIIFSGICLKF